MTILSVNKTRELDGRFAPVLFLWARAAPIFLFLEIIMRKTTRYIVYGAIIAAMYAALCHLQNVLVYGSANFAIQFRVAEALCVLAMFTPAAIPGLTVGCALYNLTFAGALPLDILFGTLASFLAAQTMWWLRKRPWVALAMPALCNALLVGWELTVYLGEAFWFNALCVAFGELVVLYTLGAVLYGAVKKHAGRIFPE